MSVTERRRELGLLRAVGATRRQVTAVVVGEATLMGLVGGVLGAGLRAKMRYSAHGDKLDHLISFADTLHPRRKVG